MRQHQPRILSSPALPSAEHRSATAIGHAPIVASWAEDLTAIGLTPPPSDAAVALWGGRREPPSSRHYGATPWSEHCGTANPLQPLAAGVAVDGLTLPRTAESPQPHRRFGAGPWRRIVITGTLVFAAVMIWWTAGV